MDKEKTQKPMPPHVIDKITRMDEKINKIWDTLLQMSDKITEMKYFIKSNMK
jgi:hypothetical protein